jgi:2,3-bisphosphoglycerate-independent phosphoglycerate mutase
VTHPSELAQDTQHNPLHEVGKTAQARAAHMHGTEGIQMTKDEHQLALLGYKQTFYRGLGVLENFIATFSTMNFCTGVRTHSNTDLSRFH